ncbi:ArsR family transcriptional regulator [Mucilaginibacter lacusdianchii]|uniref:ArsR family transcriptional regulator n=1 Tax=Mucilaginibacter lacusdianchii TaxID=2684211 RepID=UPI00131B85BF|nr:ArsR family transcriptional regulator [Mucilaginibacter sp. JXJ CY 39]
MLDTLITSKTRLKLLLKFFLNGSTKSYLRGLESEFGESSNAIRIELNRFEEAGLLVSATEGNKKIYQANKKSSIFNDIHNLLIKFVGIDEIIEKVLRRIGDLHSAYIIGDFARGIDSEFIDLLLVGDKLNENYIQGLIEKAKSIIKRKVNLQIISVAELPEFLTNNRNLLIWNAEESI